MSEIDLLIQELRDTIDNQREEIDRLNNIINEFEKWIRDNRATGLAQNHNLTVIFADMLLDKLKELKENNKDV